MIGIGRVDLLCFPVYFEFLLLFYFDFQWYIIKDMQPISCVAKVGFQELVGPLASPLKIKSPTTYATYLQQEYSKKKTLLKESLDSVNSVCTTADCWKNRSGKEFLGMTCHWLGPELQRRSAVLAVRRMKGRITYLELGKEMNSIHREFGLVGKVSETITDNGSNFVKSFKVIICYLCSVFQGATKLRVSLCFRFSW
jgi:hypothetical protein